MKQSMLAKLATWSVRGLIALALPFVVVGGAMAAGETFGTMAGRMTESFSAVAKLITALAYLAGLGFAVGAIMKFKQHKDNPTQIPIGTPIALLFIAAALLFLPSILGITGATLFESGGTTAGPSGTIFKSGN